MATKSASKASESGNIFLNFNDQRGPKAVDAQNLVRATVESIPKGQRVVLVLSKSEFGRLNIPLNLKAAETIS